MSVVCPAAVAAAAPAVVWDLLTEPRRYPEWMDVRPVPGWDRSVRTGDVVTMRAKPLPLAVRWDVIEVDEPNGRLGDGYFPGRGDEATLTRILGIMRSAAGEAGRDPKTIEVSAGGAMDPAGIEKMAELGVSRIMIPPLSFDPGSIRGALEGFAENVMAKFQ